MCKAHIALWKLQAVVTMLCRMVFQLSGKVAALHLGTCTVKACLCNQGGTVSPFFAGLCAGYWAWPTSTVLLIFQHTFLTISIWNSFTCPMEECISTLWSTIGESLDILTFHVMSPVLNLGKSINCWNLGVEYIQPSFDISGNLCLSSCISSSGSVLVSGRPCHRSVQTFESSGTMLDGGSLASHSSQHDGRCSLALSCHKRPCHCRPGTQGSTISVFTLWLLRDMCCTNKGFLPWAVPWAMQASTMKVCQQCSKEWAGWFAWDGVPNNSLSVSKLADLFRIWPALAYDWHLPFCYFCLFWNLIIITNFQSSYHQKLIHHVYLQCPPSCKCFDPWDVKQLLSLLEIWEHASLTNLNLLRRLLLFQHLWLQSVSPIYLCYALKISTVFSSVMLLFSFLHLVARWINWVISLLTFIVILIPVLIIALYFIWRLICTTLSLLQRGQMDFVWHLCLWVAIGSTGQSVL